MKNNNDLLKILKDAEKHPAFHLENAILHFTSELCEQMEIKGLSKAELARRLDKKPSYITRVLSGSTNLTLKTMVSFAMALGVTFVPELQAEVEVEETYAIEPFPAPEGYSGDNILRGVDFKFKSAKWTSKIPLEGELYGKVS